MMTRRDPKTFLRFLIAGGFNTLFGWAAYTVCILAGARPWLALIIATCAGVAFNFFSVGGYAFRDMAWRRLPRFVACYAGIYTLNLAGITLLGRWIPSPIWAQAILTPPMALMSYFLLSRLVFTAPTQ